MKTLIAHEILDGDEFAAVDLAEEADAGVHWLDDEPPVAQAHERHRAGAAVALGAALLRAEAALVEAQVIKQSRARTKAVELDNSAAPQKADGGPHADRMAEAQAFAKTRGVRPDEGCGLVR